MSARDVHEGMRSLGLPDSPVIHLAISTVAELLQPLDSHITASTRDKCITRCRVASRAALESVAIEAIRLEYRSYFESGLHQAAVEAARRLPCTDWLGQARAALVAIGIDPGPNARRMATRYGWRSDPSGSNWVWKQARPIADTSSSRRRPRISETERLQAAERLREALSSVPFYAKRAEKARLEHGDEMVYWLSLQSSQMAAHRR